MIFGAILAGGKGTRMGISEIPKQFMMLGEKPIIIHTLEKFLMSEKIDIVYLGVNETWLSYMEDIINKYINEALIEKIQIVAGGEDRNGTIMNIIDDIGKKYNLTDEDIILTHDAVRPFIRAQIILDNIEAMKKYDACDTVIPAIDTIVVSKDGEIITDIPNRIYMYQGQTPQTFKINKLKKLYTELNVEEKRILTDACKIFHIKGEKVFMVNGDIANLKITTPTDYKIAVSMLGGKISD